MSKAVRRHFADVSRHLQCNFNVMLHSLWLLIIGGQEPSAEYASLAVVVTDDDELRFLHLSGRVREGKSFTWGTCIHGDILVYVHTASCCCP